MTADETQTQTAEVESEFPAAWRPEPGDKITGKLVSVEMIDPSGMGAYPVVTIVTGDGTEHALHAFHQVLRTEIAKRHPKIGDEISVTYHGKVDKGRGYHSYRVTGGQEQEVNWDQFLDVPAGAGSNANGTVAPDVPIATENLPDVPAPEDNDPLPF